MATTVDNPTSTTTTFNFERWLARTYVINWEMVAYTVIGVIAVISRFWDLGVRVMSHDESLHTYYSWRLYDAGDFSHTPLMHGPVLFHVVAFSYFLFGVSDFSARVYPAVLGVLIVLYPILMRKWLGKTGALMASIALLVSPMVLFHSRYIREDIPNLFFLLVMVYAMLKYLDDERPRQTVWMVVFSSSLLLMLASKEVGFMYIAIFFAFLVFYWLLRLAQEWPLRHRNMDGNLFTEGSRAAWKPPFWQLIFGHLMVLGAVVILGYLTGNLLDYWHYASFSWTWVAILLGLALLIRLVVAVWDSGLLAVRTQDSRDILTVIIGFLTLVTLLIAILAAYNHQYFDGELNRLTERYQTAQQAGQIPPDLLDYEDQRDSLISRVDTNRTLSVIGLVAFGLFLAGWLGLQLMLAEESTRQRTRQWLFYTIVLLLVGLVILGFLRWLTTDTFEDVLTSLNELADELEESSDSIITIEARHLLIPFSILLYFIGFYSIGFVRTFLAKERRPGLPQMFTEGFARPKSVMMIVMAGTILGGVLALHAFGVLDIIEPKAVWEEKPIAQEIDEVTGLPAPFEEGEPTTTIELNERLGNGLLLWLGLPILVSIALIVLAGMLSTPFDRPIPWADMLAIILVATIVGGVLTYAERHSLEKEPEASDQPVAVDPNAASTAQEVEYKVGFIWGAVLLALLATILVILWRFLLPHTWGYLNRQPAFDLIIMTGTLILPWASAFPVFWAGYTLDETPFPAETVRASIWVLVAFWILSAAIGISWNWRMWLVSTGAFMALFLFFFMTVFTNGQGLLTGMVGSLGYWLEQQGVRRGSQPQYYYTLVQIPVYEFMPLLLATLGGVAGLRSIFAWRAESSVREETEIPGLDLSSPEIPQTDRLDMNALMQQQAPIPRPLTTQESNVLYAELDDIDPEIIASESDGELEEPQILDETEEVYPDDFSEKLKRAWYPQNTPFWARPYDHDEEIAMRHTNHEWMGSLPVLPFIGFWTVLITIGLTLAGEKMPWLTTHVAIPMSLIAGWYVGQIVEKIDWSALRRGGWLLLFVLAPVLMVSTMEVIVPLFGGNPPFAGQQQAALEQTYAWLGALAVTLIVGYFVTRLAAQIGFVQTRRILFAAFAGVLTLVAARAAGLAAYKNYDYPTEYLVYAHSGPAVKMTLAEIEYIADRTNQGKNLRVAFDDDSSWPMTWYLRDYNTAFFAGEASNLENNPSVLDGAQVVVVGSRKNAVVERVLGDNFYRFDYIRLWWPMQKYFDLDYDRMMNVWGSEGPDSALYREGLWDIWWNRDYQTYAQAECVESREDSCQTEADVNACYRRIEQECAGDNRYDLSNWPVSDRMYVYVDKEIAAQIWDAGIGGVDVASRDPQDAISLLYTDVDPIVTFGQAEGISGARGIDVGPDGNIYVADTNNSRIVIYSPEGQLINSFGGPEEGAPQDSGDVFQPWGVAVAPDGTVWVADTWNHRVRSFTPEGEPLITFGYYGTPQDNPGDPFAMWGPRDIEVDLNGNILVSDTGGKRVRVYAPDGTYLTDYGFGGGGTGQLSEPVGLAVNPISGDVYIADTWNRRIQTFIETGQSWREFPVDMWYDNPQSPDRPYMDVSPDGTILAVSDMSAEGRNDGPRVVIYDLMGTPLRALNAPEIDFAAGLHGIRVVAGIAFGQDGSLYVVDAETGRVVKFPPLGVQGSVLPSPRPQDIQQEQPLPTEEVLPPAETEEVTDPTQEATDES